MKINVNDFNKRSTKSTKYNKDSSTDNSKDNSKDNTDLERVLSYIEDEVDIEDEDIEISTYKPLYYDEQGNRYTEHEVHTVKVKVEFIENDIDKKFNKGELVKVYKLPGSPIMIVSDIVFDTSPNPKLLGIECYWFDSNKTYHKKIFNSKDLIKLDEI